MNGTWVKSFTDGTYEHGADKDVSKGRASWLKGRLAGIKEVEISDGYRTCKLQVEDTEWHQFDKFVVVVASESRTPTRTHRILQAKILATHIGTKVDLRTIGNMTVCKLADTQSDICKTTIQKSDVGSWLSLVLPAKDKPYIEISGRGKISERI